MNLDTFAEAYARELVAKFRETPDQYPPEPEGLSITQLARWYLIKSELNTARLWQRILKKREGL